MRGRVCRTVGNEGSAGSFCEVQGAMPVHAYLLGPLSYPVVEPRHILEPVLDGTQVAIFGSYSRQRLGISGLPCKIDNERGDYEEDEEKDDLARGQRLEELGA